MGRTSHCSGNKSNKSARNLAFIQQIELAITDGNVLIIGEFFDNNIADFCLEYKASSKAMLIELANYLKAEPEKTTVDGFKSAIEDCADGQILWIKNAQRLPLSLRLWLADNNFRLILQCDKHPKKDIFLECVALETPKPSQTEIIELFHEEAIALGVIIPQRRIQQLASGCNGSRSQIKSLIRREKLGLEPDYRLQSGNYLDISPLLLAGLAGFGVLRFMGLATGDRNLYIIGGICMMLGLASKYLARFGGK